MAVHSLPSLTRLLAGAGRLLLLALSLPLPASAAPHPHKKQGGVMMSSPLGTAEVANQCGFDVHSNIVHAPRPGVQGAPEEIYSVIAAGESATHPFLHDPGMGVSWKLWPAGAPQPVQFEWTWTPEQGRSYWDLSMIDAGGRGKRSLTARHWAPEEEYGGAYEGEGDYSQEREYEGEWPGQEAAGSPEEQGQSGGQGDKGNGWEGEEPAVVPAPVPVPAPAPADSVPAPVPAPGSAGPIAHPFAQGMTLQPMRYGQAVQEGNCVPVVCPAGAAGCTAAYNFPEDWSRQHDCLEGTTLRLMLCG